MAASLIRDAQDYSAEAIAAREAEINGKPQRIAELQLEEIDGEAREIIRTIRSSTGKESDSVIPGYMRTTLRHPALFRAQMQMGTTIFKGVLPPRERELAVLRIGWLLRAPYEWGEHVDIGKRYGITDAEIEALIVGPGAPAWTDHERAILTAVEELLANQMISDATWATLAARWNEQQLIEFPMMVGQYVATAFVQNSLRITLADHNPGLTHR
ncbi:MAG: carboxymuconolactone decarboxylase family protein [Sphingomonadales bacterium]|nr:carboxymuconolactone decarboxylase family protein [Sphingomonadales bacterium]